MDTLFNPDGLVLSRQYSQTMEDTVLPYLKARQTDLTIPGYQDKPLFVSLYKADSAARGTVFIVHGFTESAYKYSEVIYSLLQNGFCVAAYDQRGHGRSWRNEQIEDLSLTHVERFSYYERDLEKLCDALKERMPKPWSVFCHSMGGAVVSLFMMLNPDVFSRAAMCAPMIAVYRRGMPFFASKLICRVTRLGGKGKERVFFSKPYSGPECFETSCATSRERFDWYDKIKAANPLFQNNGPSYSWMLESFRITQRLLFPTMPCKIACPVRIYSAENDTDVLQSAQRLFVRGLRQGSFTVVKGARHEIYRSADEVLFPWWRDVLSYLEGKA